MSKISWHCPFKEFVPDWISTLAKLVLLVALISWKLISWIPPLLGKEHIMSVRSLDNYIPIAVSCSWRFSIVYNFCHSIQVIISFIKWQALLRSSKSIYSGKSQQTLPCRSVPGFRHIYNISTSTILVHLQFSSSCIRKRVLRQTQNLIRPLLPGQSSFVILVVSVSVCGLLPWFASMQTVRFHIKPFFISVRIISPLGER